MVLEIVDRIQPDVRPASIELTVVDVFVGKSLRYDLAELFKRTSFLAGIVYEQSATWHCNSGWFEQSGNTRVLHNLNVECVEAGAASALAVNLRHFQRLYLASDTTIEELLRDSESDLSAAMQLLHLNNKKIIGEMLADSMAKRIGLGATG
jgi:hypothetical protein